MELGLVEKYVDIMGTFQRDRITGYSISMVLSPQKSSQSTIIIDTIQMLS
jgi:hypothetical protein